MGRGAGVAAGGVVECSVGLTGGAVAAEDCARAAVREGAAASLAELRTAAEPVVDDLVMARTRRRRPTHRQ